MSPMSIFYLNWFGVKCIESCLCTGLVVVVMMVVGSGDKYEVYASGKNIELHICR